MEYHMTRGGQLGAAEIAARIEAARGGRLPPLAPRDDPELLQTIDWLIPNGASSRRDDASPPSFNVGDRVRGRRVEAAPHTRIPHYCQGRTGVVERVHDAYPLPDSVVRHEPEQVEHLYAVRFAAADLWPDAEPGTSVLADLWESYLERAA
jgi:nitrile hydratase